MAEERTIKGIVKSWGKEIKSPFKDMLKRTVHIEGDETSPQYGHGILNKDRTILENINNVAPPGTEIEFIEVKNKEFWNFKFSSLKIGKKGEPQTQTTEPAQTPEPTPFQTTVSNRDESMNIYGNMEMAMKIIQHAQDTSNQPPEKLVKTFLEVTKSICDWKKERIEGKPEKKEEEKDKDPTPKAEVVM